MGHFKDPVDFPEIVKNKFFLCPLQTEKNLLCGGNVSKIFLRILTGGYKYHYQNPYKSNLFKNVIIKVLKDKNIRNKIAFLIVEVQEY